MKQIILLFFFFLLLFSSQAQQSAYGKILDSLSGRPIVGATVSVRGTSLARASTLSGDFSLSPVEQNTWLLITAIGYAPSELLWQGRPLLVYLSPASRQLEEVTVNTGYQRLPKERVTGSFSSVSAAQLEKRMAPDLLSKLEGMTSGLVFSVDAFGNKQVSVRGQSTIFASAQPLIVLDNFPYEGDLSSIHPEDVETVTVLKDAAAASIWGVRAGNGVIVITSKKASKDQPARLEASSSVTITQKPNLFANPNYLDAASFISVEKTLFSQGFYDGQLSDPTYPVLSPVVELLNANRNGLLSSQDMETQLSAMADQDIRKDLSRYFYRPSVYQQHHLAWSGASALSSYYLSAGYDHNRASLVGTSGDRLTLKAMNHFNVTKHLEFATGIDYTKTSANRDNTLSQLNSGSGKSIYPYARLADANGNPLAISRDYSSALTDSAVALGYLPWKFYPLAEIGQNTTRTTGQEIRITATATYRLPLGFSLLLNYQYESAQNSSNNIATAESYYARDLVNQYTQISSGTPTYIIPVGGISNFSNAAVAAQNGRAQLNYSLSQGIHEVSAIAGMEFREVRTTGNGGTYYGYDPGTATVQAVNFSDNFSLFPSGNYQPVPSSSGISATLDRFRSYFTNAAYTLLQRYTISASARIDGSNYFGVQANQRTVPLWSTGLKWSLDQEKFYKLAWLPSLKLRATYGYNGNLDKSVTAYTTALYSTGALFTGAPYATILNPPNPQLRWEKTAITNLGLDFGWRNQRITGSLEFYFKKGHDLMGDALLAPSTGFISPSAGTTQLRGNFSAMTGRGIDLVLTSRNLTGKLNWTTTLVWSHATDKVTQYDITSPAYTQVNFGNGSSGEPYPLVGKPVYGIYSFRWAGLDPSTGDPQGYVGKTVSNDYAQLVQPQTPGEIVYNGPARPTWFGGLTNDLSWRHISLTFHITAKLGYYFRRTSIQYYNLFNYWIGNQDFTRRWQQPGDEAHTSIPSIPLQADFNRDYFYSRSQVLVEKADQVRLSDVFLGYTWPFPARSHRPISRLEVYGYASDLGLIWRANRQGLDPDYPAGTPPPLSLALGLRLGL